MQIACMTAENIACSGSMSFVKVIVYAWILQVACCWDQRRNHESILYDNKDSTFVCTFKDGTLIIKHGFHAVDIKSCLNSHRLAQSLELTESRLQEIPAYLDILSNLRSLTLSNNSLTTANFSACPKICPNLEFVNLDFNRIVRLRSGDLDCLKSLWSISLANNSLTTIDDGAFNEKLARISSITLINNKLTRLDTNVISRLKLSKLVDIHVNVSWNNMNLVTNSANITIDDIDPLSTHIFVSFLHNNFTFIDPEYFKTLFHIKLDFEILKLASCGFDFRFNPFVCDCAMYPIAQTLQKFHHMDPDNPLFSATCGSPFALRGKLIREVPDNDFNCSVKERCPESCTCTKTVALNLLTVQCGEEYRNTELPDVIPRFITIEINIKSKSVEKLSPKEYMENVTALDVSGCAISEIDPNVVYLMNGSQAVYLHDNNLQSLPEAFSTLAVTEGPNLTLYGNQYNCDCHLLWMKKWILEYKEKIMYSEAIKCFKGHGAGRTMADVPDDQFICETEPIATAVILSVLGGITLVTIIVTAWNRTSVKVFLITNFPLCRLLFRKQRNADFEYDIFIAHSCEDDETVNIIVDKLEGSVPPYSVCLGEKNFQVGKTITENILSVIENSCTSLLVVSNNFLRSSWCNMEFREAHLRFLRDGDISMTLILLEDIDEKLVFKELRYYMNSHTYIKFSDANFWQKLEASLARQDINEKTRLL